MLERCTHVTVAEQERIRQRVIEINLGVAEAIASRYRRRGLPYEDLVQVAYEGLVKAVHRFAPERGGDLLSFAVPTIRGELRRYFRDRGWVVRPPRRVQELQWRAHRCTEEFQGEEGRDPTAAELIEHLGTSASEYREAMTTSGCFHPASLDAAVSDAPDATPTLGDALADPAQVHGYERAEARVVLEPVLARLEGRDRQIVRMRFFEDLTQSQIAHALGITQTQVSKLLTRILRMLRRELEVPAEA